MGVSRGGVGATLGAIGAQLPYPYVHIVYWTVQLLLAITAVQYGCDIGVEWYSKVNGKITFLLFFLIFYLFFIF